MKVRKIWSLDFSKMTHSKISLEKSKIKNYSFFEWWKSNIWLFQGQKLIWCNLISDYARRNIEIPAEIKLKTGKQVSHYENGKIVNSTVLFSSNSIPLEPIGMVSLIMVPGQRNIDSVSLYSVHCTAQIGAETRTGSLNLYSQIVLKLVTLVRNLLLLWCGK